MTENNLSNMENKSPMSREEQEKIIERLWHERHPSHDINSNHGRDMFWGTVLMIIEDYNKLQSPSALPDDDEIEKQFPSLNKEGYHFKRNASKQEGAKWMREQANLILSQRTELMNLNIKRLSEKCERVEIENQQLQAKNRELTEGLEEIIKQASAFKNMEDLSGFKYLIITAQQALKP